MSRSKITHDHQSARPIAKEHHKRELQVDQQIKARSSRQKKKGMKHHENKSVVNDLI